MDNNIEYILIAEPAVYIGIAAAITIVLVSFILINRAKKINNRLKQSNKQLIASNRELEEATETTTNSLKELTGRYDELLKTKESLKKLAYSDYLTELPNLTAFTEMLDNVMLTLRSEEIVAIMDIDIDNLKTINDSQGFSYGDELLIDITYRLKEVLDENDYLARIGGDEFAIMTQNLSSSADLEEKVQKIKKVFNYPFVLSTKEYFITVSIGIAFAPKDGKTSQALLKNADAAMYVAKSNGKNTYAYFEPSFIQRLTEKIEIQSALRKAIDRNEFELYYQPQVDLATKEIVGLEALIRWNHPTKGLVYPKDFIKYAEENGLIIPIGKWALLTACKELKILETEGYDNLHMSVNIYSRQFRDNNLIKLIHEVLEETGINPNKLDLEITESVAIDDLYNTIATIKELKELGVNFSLDQFGVGYTSIDYLRSIPVNYIKLDKTFIDTALENPINQEFIQNAINLALLLEIDVVAEGIETPEQEEFLMEANCHKAQGYLYSEPLPIHEAKRLLKG
ncbi:MAG TPA: EAL domain-containing protein [Clostridiales bacterium]|nr:EAL domain-containing protein [Clostridiales bacterium]